ncbi:hypothetical protein BKA65DRAFT_560260 [Rhexocercosporidium sp. MPI-PUGE-AT-0058]|nr:hypothetical protein BKA65DRAFT_560260 [Rhexocercosporidium sp. MPI-PUGE-AT-0058]
MTLVITESRPTEPDVRLASKVHLESWILDLENRPRLLERCTIYCPDKALQSLFPSVDHNPDVPLTAELERLRVDASTELALSIVRRVSATSSQGTAFSTTLRGNHWEEVAGFGNIVVLARRRGPRRKALLRQSTDEIMNDVMPEGFHEISKEAEVDLDTNVDTNSSNESDLCLSDASKDSDLSSLSMSSGIVSSEEDLSDTNDPEIDLSDIHSDDTDSEDIMAELNYSAIGSCDICAKAMIYHFHCDVCQNGNFDICRSCWEIGSWCEDKRHQMKQCNNWKVPSYKQVSFHDLMPQQELMVVNAAYDRKALALHFMKRSQEAISKSPPILHPFMPLVAWYLGQNRLFLGNYATGSSIIYRPHSINARFRCFSASIQFSSSGKYLHVIALMKQIGITNRISSREPEELKILVDISSHILLDSKTELSHPILASYSHFQLPSFQVPEGLFSVTWTSEYAYLAVNARYMQLYRINLYTGDQKDICHLESDIKSSNFTSAGSKLSPSSLAGSADVWVLNDKLLLPATALNRAARFIPTSDSSAIVLVEFRKDPKTSLPFAIHISGSRIGTWITLLEARSKPHPKSFQLTIRRESELKAMYLKFGNIEVCLRATREEEGQIIFRSPDGILVIKSYENYGYVHIGFDAHGGRKPVAWTFISTVPPKSPIRRITPFDARIPLMEMADRDGTLDIDMEPSHSGDGQAIDKLDANQNADAQVLRQLYPVTLSYSIPKGDHEKGTYWRLSGDRELTYETPSTLCTRCRSLKLSPKDFVHDNSEEEDDGLVDWEELGSRTSYTIRCDGCRAKLMSPCTFYRCDICNNGQYDLCSGCYQNSSYCRSRKHLLRKTTFEHRYVDGIINSTTEAVSHSITTWNGCLGTFEEIKRRSFCALCRLTLRSLQESRGYKERVELPDSENPDSENIRLTWYAYGWNHKRWHSQARYLVAKWDGSEKKGIPLVLLSECDPFAPFTGRRLDNSTVHIPIFKAWMKYCEEHHGWSCHGPRHLASSGLKNLKVIDVVDKCIVEIPFPSRFATLSYVWGKAQQFRALSSNIRNLEKKGYLMDIEGDLSRTVTDAMEFALRMGERYLWVDALCIVQDDQEAVNFLTDKMDLIYEGSIFTIIAAAGDNVEAGLPGLYPGSRRTEQYIEEIHSDVKLLLLSSPEVKLRHSVHQSRGWTFQETILSRRRFIFLDDIVYFQCERRTCREDFCERRPDVVSSILQNADRNTTASSYLYNRPGRAYGPGGAYERLVQAYLRRTLSFESDIIRAFQGVLRAMEQRRKLNFFVGMPIEYLDSSLLWAPRRQTKRRPGFASFSWAGWTEEAIWPAQDGVPHPFISFTLADNKQWYLNNTYIEWHQSSNGAKPKLVSSSGKPAYSWLTGDGKDKHDLEGREVQTDAMGRQINTKEGEAKENKTNDEKSRENNLLDPNLRDTLPKIPSGGVHWHSKLPNEACLCVYGVVIQLYLEESDTNLLHPDHFRSISLKCQYGSTHGFVIVPDNFEFTPGAQGNAVVLSSAVPGSILKFHDHVCNSSTGMKTKGARRQAYYIMLVEKREEGVVERIGIGMLGRSALACKLPVAPRWEYLYLV